MTQVLPIDAFAPRAASEPASSRDGTGDAFDRLLGASFDNDRLALRAPQDRDAADAQAATKARDRTVQSERADRARDDRAATETGSRVRETRSPINDRVGSEPVSSGPTQETRPINDKAAAKNSDGPTDTPPGETSKAAAADSSGNAPGANISDAGEPASQQTASDTAAPGSEAAAQDKTDTETPAAGTAVPSGVEQTLPVFVAANAATIQPGAAAGEPAADSLASTSSPPASSARPASAGTIREGQVPGAGFAPELRDSDLPAVAARAASEAAGKAVAAALRAQPATTEAAALKAVSSLFNVELTGRRQNPDGSFSTRDGAPAIPGMVPAGSILGQTAARFGLALNIMALPGSTGTTLNGLISPELLSALNGSTNGGQAGEGGSSGQQPGGDAQTAARPAAPLPAPAPAPSAGGTPFPATTFANLQIQGDAAGVATPATGTTNGAPAQGSGLTAAAARFTVPTTLPLDQLAVFIARAAQPGNDRFTIRLHPAELGRVEVSMDVARDGRVTAVLTAEKQYTLDLLQRDARMLERALVDSGLQADAGSLSFSLFDQGNGADQALDESAAAPVLIAAEDDDSPPDATLAMAKVRLVGDGPGVDIRI